MKNLLKQIILERQAWLTNVHVIPRPLSIEKKANYAFVGLRRAGKSYSLYQIIKNIVRESSIENVLLINFEDERLIEMTFEDLHLIMDAYNELYAHTPVIFLDEIQNVQHWEKFARRLADDGFQIFVTGSNADMLSHEIATTLGGRFVNKEILPLSFREYLSFKNIDYSERSLLSPERFNIIRTYEVFLQFGGFPELLHFEDKREFLSSVYQKLFYGDVIARYSITNATLLKLLIKKIAESVNNETSINRIKNLIKSTGLPVGNNTLFEYIAHLESSFIIKSISNYYGKFKDKETRKKYYFLDTGILGLFLQNQDTKLLENQIYIELHRRGYTPYFLKAENEVDFFVPEQNLLIQVSYSIKDDTTYVRELKGLTKAMQSMNIIKGYIITYNEEKSITTNEGAVIVIPAWKWLIQR